ncbi:NAD-dependent succinate-semialdehyde dehydrogenase [Sphingobacterium litopenaei]|uniref:NAD-dependent succinate-semialdehyde dehydrogenase n=1 Tax=Sphingobacterium litopenaei TaxID=2763500 RepID=A0ABR7YIG0_9SPHI|nr:NAD-dependent succinate-semialdehyde dehydrogenase [Sphingobacterium litopenaei]MBD1431061.1 NAD-dependent succinate-semialdehyde dehydrogenase [Sphingobacterium litopenaei]
MKNSLFIQEAYLNGEFISSENTFEIINPSTNKSIGTLPNLTVEDCKKVIESAHEAWLSWKNTPVGDRCAIVRKIYELTIQHKQELAEIMTLESGKPLSESLGEVDYGNAFVEWFAEEGKRSYGETIPSMNGTTRISTIKQGVGVVAAITPWNFPLAMISRKLAPALMAGCTMVLKPASQTPFTAIALAKICEMAGVPKGVFSVVTSKDSKGLGKELATNPLVRKLTFTGSTEVGSTLMAQAAETIKRVSFELGGNAPFLVFDDADIDAAVKGAVAGKFRNAGQTCVSINRFFVQESVYEEFSQKLAQAVKNLIVADGLAKNSQVGPLINASAVKKVTQHVEDAVSKGAKILTGGKLIEGNFFAPTVMTDVSDDALIQSEETFGPICALFKYKTEEEAIQKANDTPFGLAAYFYSENVRRCQRVGEALEAGMIGINTGLISNASAPFGGIKQSGIGREGSKYGLDEYMEIKYLCYGI